MVFIFQMQNVREGHSLQAKDIQQIRDYCSKDPRYDMAQANAVLNRAASAIMKGADVSLLRDGEGKLSFTMAYPDTVSKKPQWVKVPTSSGTERAEIIPNSQPSSVRKYCGEYVSPVLSSSKDGDMIKFLVSEEYQTTFRSKTVNDRIIEEISSQLRKDKHFSGIRYDEDGSRITAAYASDRGAKIKVAFEKAAPTGKELKEYLALLPAGEQDAALGYVHAQMSQSGQTKEAGPEALYKGLQNLGTIYLPGLNIKDKEGNYSEPQAILQALYSKSYRGAYSKNTALKEGEPEFTRVSGEVVELAITPVEPKEKGKPGGTSGSFVSGNAGYHGSKRFKEGFANMKVDFPFYETDSEGKPARNPSNFIVIGAGWSENEDKQVMASMSNGVTATKAASGPLVRILNYTKLFANDDIYVAAGGGLQLLPSEHFFSANAYVRFLGNCHLDLTFGGNDIEARLQVPVYGVLNLMATSKYGAGMAPNFTWGISVNTF